MVVRKLLELASTPGSPIGVVRGLVRSAESGKRLEESLPHPKGLEIVVGDVTDAESLEAAVKGIDALVILTSAKPQISKLSIARMLALKLVTLTLASAKPSFWYPEGQGPEQVDWLGQRAQIDAAQAAGVRHVVLVSSMCGTKPEHFLNTQMDNIVLWKRKAECHLVHSGLPYTIIHPGGLLPHQPGDPPAPGGRRQLYVAVDDDLLKEDGFSNPKAMVPREDVAEVCVRCLLDPEVSMNRSFDLGSGPEDEGEIFKGDLKALLATLEGKNCAYTEADAAFCALEPSKERGLCCS